MTVSLSPRLKGLIREKVAHGLYRTTDEAIEAAVQLLDEHDRRLQRLRAAIAEGEAGEATPLTWELMERFSREADEMHRRGEKPNPDLCP